MSMLGIDFISVSEDMVSLGGEIVKIPETDLIRFKNILRFLNQKDRDILMLVYVSGKRQSELRRILEQSQPSLCYGMSRLKDRIKYAHFLDSYFDRFVDYIDSRGKELDDVTKHGRDVAVGIFYTTSLSVTAEFVDSTAIRIKNSLDDILTHFIKTENYEMFELFNSIKNSLNVIRREYKNEGSFEKKDGAILC